MTTQVQLERMVDRQAQRRRSITARLIAMLWNAWRPFDGWYDDDLVTSQAARSADLVDAASLEAYLTAREYVWQVAVASGRPVPDLPPASGPLYPRSNTTALDVYTRPAETFRYLRSHDEPTGAALDSVLQRIEKVAELDLAAINRQAVRDAFEVVGVTRYRRVIHPELSIGGTCGLCIAASTRIYYVAELLPIHGGCHCDAVELDPRGGDLADALNLADLDRIYGEAGGNDRDALLRTRYKVTNHSELGPVLELANARETAAHRAAREAKATSLTPGPDQWQAEITTLERSSAALAARASAGEDVATPLGWQRDRLANLRERLAAAA